MMWQFINKFVLIILTCILYNITNIYAQPRDFFSTRVGVGSMMITENKTFFNDYIPQLELSYARTYEGRDTGWVDYVNAKYHLITLNIFDQRDLDGFSDTSKSAFGYYIGLNYAFMLRLCGKKRVKLYIVPGFGIGYDTKTYYDDPRNIFIGSKINTNGRLELMNTIELNKQLTFSQGIRFYHYSNSAFYMPNRGINTMSYLIGLDYYFDR